jgi:hypothetical protein
MAFDDEDELDPEIPVNPEEAEDDLEIPEDDDDLEDEDELGAGNLGKLGLRKIQK